MSDKINFSINSDLLSGERRKGTSGQITHALKTAYQNIDDFLNFTKRTIAQDSSIDRAPDLRKLISKGRLLNNLDVDFSGIKCFIAKGAEAEYNDDAITIMSRGRAIIKLSCKLRFQWRMEKNEFNNDEICIAVSRKEDDADE